ncbi:MAG: hypothetical protein QNJ63_31485 [Calothrix sp. MO_192.B10]|nr:hypothetical protein [Calothrix sp. MO_192.B10]
MKLTLVKAYALVIGKIIPRNYLGKNAERMHVISKVKLREFWMQHADSEDALNLSTLASKLNLQPNKTHPTKLSDQT